MIANPIRVHLDTQLRAQLQARRGFWRWVVNLAQVRDHIRERVVVQAGSWDRSLEINR